MRTVGIVKKPAPVPPAEPALVSEPVSELVSEPEPARPSEKKKK